MTTSNLTIQNSTISSNTAGNDGGGLHLASGTMFLQNTVVCGNSPEQIAATNWADQGGNTIDVECESCTGDFDGDGSVGIDDLLTVLENWGEGNSDGDLSGDGDTTIDDLLIVIGVWGECL